MVRCIKASSVARDGCSRRERVTPLAAMCPQNVSRSTDQRYTAVFKLTQSHCPPGNTQVNWCSPHRCSPYWSRSTRIAQLVPPRTPNRHFHFGALHRNRPLRGTEVTAMAQMPVPTCSSRAADADTRANLVMIGTAKSLNAVAPHVVGHNKDTMQAPGCQKHLKMLAFKDVLNSNSAFRTGPAGAGCASRWQALRLLQFLLRVEAAMSRQPGIRRFTRRESLCQSDHCRHRGMGSTVVSDA